MFSAETIAALAVCIVLGFAIPIAAVIIYKRRFREAWLPSAFIGAGAIIVFGLIELLLYVFLYVFLLPLILRVPSASVIISAVMAGAVEETARLAAYKTLMKNHLSTKNAVLLGLGCGGFETIVALGLTFLLYLIMAVTANGYGGLEAFLEATRNNSSSNSVSVTMAVIEETRFIDILLPIYGRLLAMTFHVCLSVWVYKAVTHKLWLYPAAIAAHAAYDYIAMGVIKNHLLLEAILTVIVTAAVFVTIKLTKKLPDNAS